MSKHALLFKTHLHASPNMLPQIFTLIFISNTISYEFHQALQIHNPNYEIGPNL